MVPSLTFVSYPNYQDDLILSISYERINQFKYNLIVINDIIFAKKLSVEQIKQWYIKIKQMLLNWMKISLIYQKVTKNIFLKFNRLLNQSIRLLQYNFFCFSQAFSLKIEQPMKQNTPNNLLLSEAHQRACTQFQSIFHQYYPYFPYPNYNFSNEQWSFPYLYQYWPESNKNIDNTGSSFGDSTEKNQKQPQNEGLQQCENPQILLKKEQNFNGQEQQYSHDPDQQSINSEEKKKILFSRNFSQKNQIKLEEYSQQIKKPRKYSESKNITKNFGKAIINFILKQKALTQRIIQPYQITYKAFKREVIKLRPKTVTIQGLRSFWLDKNNPYAKPIRILSSIFLRKYCFSYIFHSRIKNYSKNLKYRQKIMSGLSDPEHFTYLTITQTTKLQNKN